MSSAIPSLPPSQLDGPVVAACPGGIAAMDARGDTVAVAGYGLRAGGVLVPDNCVRVRARGVG